MEWTYIRDKKPEEDYCYLVACIVNGDHETPYICLAYLEGGVWYFSNGMIPQWTDGKLEDYGWVPYAYQKCVIPEPAKLREK